MIKVAVYAEDPVTRIGLTGPITANPQLTLAVQGSGEAADVTVVSLDSVDASTWDILKGVRAPTAGFFLVVERSWHADYSRAAECGVRAMLWRADFSAAKFVDVIRHVGEGGADFPVSVQGGFLDHVRRVQSEVLDPRGLTASGLSAREVDVLRLAAEGYVIAEISQKLSYSERTIKNVFYGLMKQLKLRNRTHVVSYAIREGLI